MERVGVSAPVAKRRRQLSAWPLGGVEGVLAISPVGNYLSAGLTSFTVALVLGTGVVGCASLGRDCISLCQASGCGESVAGGCCHLCANMRPSARQSALKKYELLANERTLDRAIETSSFIGVVRTEAVREVSLSEAIIEATVLSTWTGSAGSPLQLSNAGRDSCDPSTYRARPGQEALVFLSPASGGAYTIAGRGWGYLPIEKVEGEIVAVGIYPTPGNVEFAASEDEYRTRTWAVPITRLREEVDSVR